jgi:hydrogenase expression/formation protein HypC
MCLAVPGIITEMISGSGLQMCKVDFGGVIRETCIEAIPEAKLGDYIIVHAGFALNILSEEEALATLDTLREISLIEEEIIFEENCKGLL